MEICKEVIRHGSEKHKEIVRKQYQCSKCGVAISNDILSENFSCAFENGECDLCMLKDFEAECED